MAEAFSHMEVVAIRKSGVEGWEPYIFALTGEGAKLTGSVPRLLTRGRRKGQKTWDGKGTSVLVTRAEVQAQAAAYVAETGNCPKCYGEARIVTAWNSTIGATYEGCPECSSTGRAVSDATPAKSN